MTPKPKEKAKEMIDEFLLIRNALYRIAREEVLLNVAKQNAIIAVNLLIAETRAKYWYDVKRELHKL
jgi:membrane protein CcdC involved in cytochrome C biogenesis